MNVGPLPKKKKGFNCKRSSLLHLKNQTVFYSIDFSFSAMAAVAFIIFLQSNLFLLPTWFTHSSVNIWQMIFPEYADISKHFSWFSLDNSMVHLIIRNISHGNKEREQNERAWKGMIHELRKPLPSQRGHSVCLSEGCDGHGVKQSNTETQGISCPPEQAARRCDFPWGH